jgi:hypothetical protein
MRRRWHISWRIRPAASFTDVEAKTMPTQWPASVGIVGGCGDTVEVAPHVLYAATLESHNVNTGNKKRDHVMKVRYWSNLKQLSTRLPKKKN